MSNSPLKQHPSGLIIQREERTKEKSGKKGYFTRTKSPKVAAPHVASHTVPPTPALSPLMVPHSRGLSLPWMLQRQASKHQDFHPAKMWKTQLNNSLLPSSVTLLRSQISHRCLLFKRSLNFFAKQAVRSVAHMHTLSKYHSSCFSLAKSLSHSGNKAVSRACTIALNPSTASLVEVTHFASNVAGCNIYTCMKHYN